jgi:ABC-2 type transport system permease protein
MFETIRHMIRKEFIQVFRDRRMLIPIFLAPVVQLILFGYAANIDVRHIPFAVVDNDRTPESRALLSVFTQSGYFDLEETLDSPQEIDRRLLDGTIQAALVIPPDFARKLAARQPAPVQVILDGSNANSATIIQNYAVLIAAKYSERLIVQALPPGQAAPNFFEPRIWYNPELKSSNWMVPGVISLILLLTTLILTAMAITREREIGTLEQLIVSPIRPIELILGKTIPFVIFGFCDIIIVLVAGKIVFDIPLRGSIPFLLVCSLVFILTTLGAGLFISTISRTQGQAMMSAMFFVMPAMLLSGVFSPIESMPKIIQLITYLNPLRYFGKIVRGILLKGNGFSILWPELTALLAFGVATIVLSSIRFKKRLE